MTRNGRVMVAVGSIMVAYVLVSAGPALAGGGCHGAATEGTGDTVILQEACFTPSLIHVAAGDTLTFRNEDPFAHNVVGNGWGVSEDLQTGERFTQTFQDAGVYPFACTLHPGMTGAVLVGDTDHETANVAAVPAAPSPPTDEDRSSGSLLPAAVGFAIGGALVGALRRRRATVPVPA